MKPDRTLRIAALAAMLMRVAAVHAQASAGATVAGTAPAYYISEFELTDAEGIKPYSAAVESTFTPFGGRYAVRGGQRVPLEGAPPQRIVMIAFPSLAQAQAWYDSPAYRALRAIRHRSATSRVFIVEGFGP